MKTKFIEWILFPLLVVLFLLSIVCQFTYYYIICVPISALFSICEKLRYNTKYLEEYHLMLKDIAPYRLYVIFHPKK